MKKVIVLLDVDGVLIHARGYSAGIRAAFEYITKRMGQMHIAAPDDSAIHAFEAKSIIFEWDSLALCMAELLNQLPQTHTMTFDTAIHSIAGNGAHLTQPDFADLARRCPPGSSEVKPGRAALGTVFPENPLFTELLANTHDVSAPMTQIFQHFVLGHEQFARTYRRDPIFETESLLEKLDIPMLTPESIDRMRADAHVLPVVYTARPSLPPGFVLEWHGYSPEAEIARRMLGLLDTPLIGYGRMQWIARQKNVPAGNFVKPSPIHALTAIYSALLYGSPRWEEKALEMVIADEPPPGDNFEVAVCEDSTGGIRGAREAVEMLRQRYNLDIDFTAIGVASAPEKIAALEPVADVVVPDVNQGLAHAAGW